MTAAPTPTDVVAFVRVRYHADGRLSVDGNIADKVAALAMLEHAKDAISGQRAHRDELVLPNRDVRVEQAAVFPTLPRGDMRPQDRGDA